MQDFQIISEKRYPLKVFNVSDNVDLLPYHRWEHRVTLGRRGRRYMVFLDNLKQSVYIEEITDGRVERIDDESLWKDVFRHATEKGYLNMLPPIYKPHSYNHKTTIMDKAITLKENK
ncbi:MAG: hypothetical protein ACXABY_36180 [Candidatus Thorarchaeota archaeon]|jgi:hypothetical protein